MARPVEFHRPERMPALLKAQETPAPSTSDARANPPDPGDTAELTLKGRRYRLVPIEPESTCEPTPPAIVDLLTARELQIVALVAEGRVNKQIADALRISEFTVSTHLRRIFTKIGVDTRAAMVSKCLKALA